MAATRGGGAVAATQGGAGGYSCPPKIMKGTQHPNISSTPTRTLVRAQRPTGYRYIINNNVFVERDWKYQLFKFIFPRLCVNTA